MRGHRSRKRREIRTVALSRGRSGFGFTITGELPCRLGGVVSGSAADCAGLQSGDRLIRINGEDVSALSHDEVVRRIGCCRNILRLNVAEQSSEDSSADSSDNAETYADRMVNDRLHPRPITVTQQPGESLAWDVRQSGFPNGYSVRNKYGRHVHNSHTERFHTHSVDPLGGDRHMSSRYSHDYLDLHLTSELPHGVIQRRKTKHTVITREARIGIRPPERLPHPDDRCSHNMCDASDDDDISLSSSELQIVVGYSGSVEMPSDAPRLAGSRLQSIRSAVNRLHATNRTRSLVVMDISADGIRLTDAMCRVVACYVTSRIAFCGICPDDRRFFGIVMTSGDSHGAYREKGTNSSCHVFMVDPEMAEHHLHAGIAARFGLNCTMDLDTPRCLEFPQSAVPIISFLGKLYRHRKSTTSLAPLPGIVRSTNVRGIHEGKAKDSRVYVVDVCKDNSDQHSGGDSNAEVTVPSEENGLFIHNLSVIEPVLGDGNLLDSSEPPQPRKDDERNCVGRGHLMRRSLSQASSILRESNRHMSSSGLRRVITASDDNSLRQSTYHMPPYFMHSQPMRRCTTDNDSDENSSSSVQGNEYFDSSSPVPPPVPPKLCVSKYTSGRQPAAHHSHPVAGPVTASIETPNGSGRPLPVPQSCSASKPPLPERRPTSTRRVQKAKGILKKDILDRPKSTPPVNKMSLPAAVESVNYDSDPGERPSEERGKQDYVTCQSDDHINSPEDLCVEMVKYYVTDNC